jgi:hypothetical protein
MAETHSFSGVLGDKQMFGEQKTSLNQSALTAADIEDGRTGSIDLDFFLEKQKIAQGEQNQNAQSRAVSNGQVPQERTACCLKVLFHKPDGGVVRGGEQDLPLTLASIRLCRCERISVEIFVG